MKSLLFLALLSLASATEDATKPIEKAFDQTHVATVTAKDRKVLDKVAVLIVLGVKSEIEVATNLKLGVICTCDELVFQHSEFPPNWEIFVSE